MESILEHLNEGCILLDQTADSQENLFDTLAGALIAAGRLTADTKSTLIRALLDRETLASTGIGGGIALPHAYVTGVKEGTVLFCRLRAPMEYAASDGQPVRLLFLLTGATQHGSKHLKILAKLARLLRDGAVIKDLLAADSAQAVRDALGGVEKRHGG